MYEAHGWLITVYQHKMIDIVKGDPKKQQIFPILDN